MPSFPITGMLLALNNINPLSFVCVHCLSLDAFWFFLTTLSRIYVLLPCFVFACLLAFSHWYRYRLSRYCFSLFSNSTFPVISFVLFQCLPFFVSHYSSFSHQFYLPVFSLFAYFLLWWSHSFPRITNLFLFFLSTFHSLDYSFQRLMNLACSWNI